MTSPDGINWSDGVTIPTSAGGWKRIIWAEELYSFIATGNTISMTSQDATSWVSAPMPGGNWLDAAWSAKLSAAVAATPSSGLNFQLAISNNGYQLTSGIKGTASSDNANPGHLGEHKQNKIASSSPVTISTTGTPQNITSIPSLPAGDWDVSLLAGATLNGATLTGTGTEVAISTVSATLPGTYGDAQVQMANPVSGLDSFGAVPVFRVSLATATTVYLVGQMTFSAGNPKMYGRLTARRVR